MGLDGGTVVTRSDVLRGQSWRVAQNDTSRSTRGGNVTKVQEETAEKRVERAIAWSNCALSSQPLRHPIVACGLGRLYNKDAALQFLLCKKASGAAAGDKGARAVSPSPEALLQYANQLRVAGGTLDHLASLKDLLTVHLHTAAAPPSGAAASASAAGPSAASAGAAGADGGPAAPFVCPITLLPCDQHPCSALRPCGHVLSDRALRNLGGDTACPVCGAASTSRLPINGTAEQVERLKELMRAGAGSKSGRKRKAPDGDGEAGAAAGATETTPEATAAAAPPPPPPAVAEDGTAAAAPPPLPPAVAEDGTAAAAAAEEPPGGGCGPEVPAGAREESV